jgi:biopolymer transport protein ExbD
MKVQPSLSLSDKSMPWSRWVLLSALLLLLSAPFLLDLKIPYLRCYRGKLVLPAAVTSVRLPDLAAKISIGKSGVVRVSDGEEMSLPISDLTELGRFVSNLLADHPDRPFVLVIDRDTPYAKVAMVLSVMRESGAGQVYFHTVLPT